MAIKNEQDITGDVAVGMRLAAKLSQAKFWAPFGLPQSSGSRYESNGQHECIPRAVRILMFLRYVIGIEIDATTDEGIAALRELARKQGGKRKNSTTKDEHAIGQ